MSISFFKFVILNQNLNTKRLEQASQNLLFIEKNEIYVRAYSFCNNISILKGIGQRIENISKFWWRHDTNFKWLLNF